MQQLGVLPPLRLAQAVTLAQVLRAGALLTDELTPACTPEAHPDHPAF